MLALVMAGGSGTRFWPKSRERHPKQLLQIIGTGTMLQNSVERLQGLIPPEKVFIVCKQVQYQEVIIQVPQIPQANVIVEPRGKSTGPCIGLAALFMQERFGDEVMTVLPSDHLISPAANFQETLSRAAKFAASADILITLGIKPTFPATGYGYIQVSDEYIQVGDDQIQRVKTFAEKPNLETAKRFLESGDFWWNSGMFIWKISTILDQFDEHLADLGDGLKEIRRHLDSPRRNEVIDRVYQQIRSISIDYGVMEHAKNVAVLPANFEWNDLGSWEAVYDLMPKDEQGNASCGGDHVYVDSTDNLIDVRGKAVAVLGLNGIFLVETDDAILVCAKSHAQEVKEVVERLKRKKRYDLI